MSQTEPKAFVGLPKLTSEHDCDEFNSGADELDEWLKERALNSTMSGNANTYVATTGGQRVVAYYALAAAGVANDSGAVPGAVRRQAPNEIPCLILARLAVDQSFQGKRLEKRLFQDALWRSARVAKDIGFRALLVHARDEAAVAFYMALTPSFRPSPSDPLHLYLPFRALLEIQGS